MTYKDPLHIGYEQLTVYHKGLPYLVLNKELLDKQNAWLNLEAIKDVHSFKLIIHDIIEETEDRFSLKSLAQDLREIEFELQRLWGFEEDANFHRFWVTPKCCCPYYDNEERYPYNVGRVVNQSCPLHGSK